MNAMNEMNAMNKIRYVCVAVFLYVPVLRIGSRTGQESKKKKGET